MVTALACLSLLILFRQHSKARIFAAAVYLVNLMINELALSDIEGPEYYGISAMLDLLIIIITSQIRPIPMMVINLHRLCLVSIFLNGIGGAMWYFYFPPDLYNYSFMGLYIVGIFILCERDHAPMDDPGTSSWLGDVFGRSCSSAGYSFKSGKKI